MRGAKRKGWRGFISCSLTSLPRHVLLMLTRLRLFYNLPMPRARRSPLLAFLPSFRPNLRLPLMRRLLTRLKTLLWSSQTHCVFGGRPAGCGCQVWVLGHDLAYIRMAAWQSTISYDHLLRPKMDYNQTVIDMRAAAYWGGRSPPRPLPPVGGGTAACLLPRGAAQEEATASGRFHLFTEELTASAKYLPGKLPHVGAICRL